LHKARETPKDKFHDEIEKLLTGASESSDLIYFKLYKSQIPVVEQALEVAARMLGSDRSRGYCLELICADFWPVPVCIWRTSRKSCCWGCGEYFICCRPDSFSPGSPKSHSKTPSHILRV